MEEIKTTNNKKTMYKWNCYYYYFEDLLCIFWAFGGAFVSLAMGFSFYHWWTVEIEDNEQTFILLCWYKGKWWFVNVCVCFLVTSFVPSLHYDCILLLIGRLSAFVPIASRDDADVILI